MDELVETFVPIRDFPHYMISNKGNVMSIRRNQILQPINRGPYLGCNLYNDDGHKTMTIHRLVATHFLPNHESKPWVDHIDGNHRNNHLHNLRWCTCAENRWNSAGRIYSSSQYKGVTWKKDHNSWHSSIVVDGRQRHLGYFKDQTEAAIMYDTAALNHCGEYARLNFPQ